MPAAATARIPLPTGFTYRALIDNGTALADDGTALYATTVGSSAAPTRLASYPVYNNPCPEGDPVYKDSAAGVMAVNEGRVLILVKDAGICAPGFGTWEVGPYAGPFAPLRFDCAGHVADPAGSSATSFAVSTAAAALGCAGASGAVVTAIPADPSGPAQTFHFPGASRARVKLAGHYLAVSVAAVSNARIAVIDVSAGSQAYAVNVPSPATFALAADGTLIAGTGTGCASTLTGLAWYSPSSPIAHALPYRACGTLLLRSGEVIFEGAGPDHFVTVERGDLAGAPATVLTTLSASGVLIDGNDSEVLAADTRDCQGGWEEFVAPGGPPDNPGPRHCPVAFTSHHAAATYDSGELSVVVPLRCPIGCDITQVTLAGDPHTTTDSEGLMHGSFKVKVSTDSASAARVCRLYERELMAYRHHRGPRPRPPVVSVKVRSYDRDGTTRVLTGRLALGLRFSRA